MDTEKISIDLSTITDETITINSITPTFTWSLNNTAPTYIFDEYESDGMQISRGNLNLHAEADIKIGDQSLLKRIQRIEERLAIINDNAELEQTWPELQQAADQYRKLEKEFTNKQKVWDRLNIPLPKDNK